MQGAYNFARIRSYISTCIKHGVSATDALNLAIQGIEEHWLSVCDVAQLSEVDKKLLWGRQFLNPFSTMTIT
jgi:serine/threonine-protein kinase HipA